MSRTPSSPSRHTALHARWQALAAREQQLLRAAALLVLLALLWWLALAPALQTLRTAPARHAALDAQLQHMQALQSEAQALQNAPRADPDNALRALQSAVSERLGPGARLSVSGARATLTLKNTGADALAQWLVQVRSNAKAVPQEAHWTRSAAGADPALPTGAHWDGTLVLSLPAR